TGTLSFPTPTAIAVNVPALSTVPQAIEPETESANPARDQRTRADRRRARQANRSDQADQTETQSISPAADRQIPDRQAAAQQTPNLPDQPAAAVADRGADQPVPQPPAIPVILFGQPLPQ
ncbi:MAG: hypothetical protein ACKO7W_02640, partial [Elainella sp.]